MKPELVLVVAGNFVQYKRWCIKNGYHQFGQYRAVYIMEPFRLQCYDRSTAVILLGDWYRQHRVMDFYDTIEAIGFTNVRSEEI